MRKKKVNPIYQPKSLAIEGSPCEIDDRTSSQDSALGFARPN